MKKLLSALVCAMLISACAAAEAPVFPTPSPSPEVSAAPEATPAPETHSTAGSMDFTMNGKAHTLAFDPDPEYSICKDGYVQASFYVEEADGLLYELYVTFPQTVKSGDAITPESCIQSSDIASGVLLYVSDNDGNDVCSAATQYMTGPYPEGSAYSINFSDVTAEGTVHTFKGTMTCSLVEVDDRFYATSTINECTATFDFTMDLNTAASEKEYVIPDKDEDSSSDKSEIPELPESTPESEATPEPKKQYPPTPPAKLVTPSDAKSI